MLLGAWVQVVPAAHAQELNHFYFPWVPNGDSVDGYGPWYGKLTVQNMSDDICALSIYVGRSGNWSKTAQLSLTAGSTRSPSSSSLGVPSPGAAVRLDAFCPISASVKFVKPDVSTAPWSDGADAVSGYTGMSDSDLEQSLAGPTSGWFLPIVQTNSDWNSTIRLANLDSSGNTDVTVALYPANNTLGAAGVTRTITRQLGIGAVTMIDLLNEVGPEWVGYAEIRSTGPVGVLVHRMKPGASMALTNVAVAGDLQPDESRFLMAAPLLFTAYNGWNTGINLANVSNDVATVSIRYFETAGGQVREDTLMMAPRSMQYLYTPHNVQQEDFVGSAMIESDAPLVAAIDEVKYSTVEAISYLASTVGQQDASIALTFREDPFNGEHDNSGINIQNMNPNEAQTVEISLVTNTGADVLPQPFLVTLPAGGNNFMYLPDVDDVPFGTVAAARLRSSDPYGFVAVSNDVNYAVTGDGSVTFMATGAAGYYHVLGAPEP